MTMEDNDPKADIAVDKIDDVAADIDRAEASETVEILPNHQSKPKRGVGFGVLLLMSLMAAGAGAIGGAVLPHYWDMGQLTPSKSQSAAHLDDMQSDIASLKTQLVQVKAVTSAKPNIQPATTETLQKVDLVPLEDRLAALEARPVVTEAGAVIDPGLVKRVDALEAAAASVPTEAKAATSEKLSGVTPADISAA